MLNIRIKSNEIIMKTWFNFMHAPKPIKWLNKTMRLKKEEKISNKILLIYFFTVNFTVLDEEVL